MRDIDQILMFMVKHMGNDKLRKCVNSVSDDFDFEYVKPTLPPKKPSPKKTPARKSATPVKTPVKTPIRKTPSRKIHSKSKSSSKRVPSRKRTPFTPPPTPPMLMPSPSPKRVPSPKKASPAKTPIRKTHSKKTTTPEKGTPLKLKKVKVKTDSNSQFRAIAVVLGFSQLKWKGIKKDLQACLKKNYERFGNSLKTGSVEKNRKILRRARKILETEGMEGNSFTLYIAKRCYGVNLDIYDLNSNKFTRKSNKASPKFRGVLTFDGKHYGATKSATSYKAQAEKKIKDRASKTKTSSKTKTVSKISSLAPKKTPAKMKKKRALTESNAKKVKEALKGTHCKLVASNPDTNRFVVASWDSKKNIWSLRKMKGSVWLQMVSAKAKKACKTSGSVPSLSKPELHKLLSSAGVDHKFMTS